MSKFSETVTEDTPKFVIKFNKTIDSNDEFDWKVFGKIPIVSLIGAISKVQSELSIPDMDSDNYCPYKALVITYDCTLDKFDWFMHPDAPLNAMIGMMMIITQSLIVQVTMAAQQAKQQIIIPDNNGRIFRG